MHGSKSDSKMMTKNILWDELFCQCDFLFCLATKIVRIFQYSSKSLTEHVLEQYPNRIRYRYIFRYTWCVSMWNDKYEISWWSARKYCWLSVDVLSVAHFGQLTSRFVILLRQHYDTVFFKVNLTRMNEKMWEIQIERQRKNNK